jgi:hypothetical protein
LFDKQKGIPMLIILTVVSIGVMIFVVYFLFKALGFVINATRLYRKMIDRQDSIIKLLVDIRDNSKTINDDLLRNIEQKMGN